MDHSGSVLSPHLGAEAAGQAAAAQQDHNEDEDDDGDDDGDKLADAETRSIESIFVSTLKSKTKR